MRQPPILSETTPADAIAPSSAPSARRVPARLEIHGDVRTDDYFWLREKSNPEVIAYLEEENRYADAVMAPTARLQETLYREMLSHVKESDVSMPYRENGYFYYSRTEEGKQYPIFCRRRGAIDAPEEVTLDGNALAEGKPFLAIGDYAISDDGSLLAYSLDESGDREYTLHVKNLATGEMVGAPIEGTAADSVVWSADGATLFYAVLDPAKRPHRFCRRRLGASVHDVVFEEEDERFDLGAFRSRSGRFVFLSSGSHTCSEVRFAEAADPGAEFRLVAPREDEHEYDVDHLGEDLYIRTNGPDSSGRRARNFRLVAAPVSDPGPAHWREVVAERPDVMIEGFDCFARHLVRYERENALPRIVVTDVSTGDSHALAFSEPVYSVRPTGNREFETATLRYSYESLVTPPSVFDYDMESREALLRKRTEVPGYDSDLYEQERIVAEAGGARIPISLVRRRVAGGVPAPMDLWGYGSYGLNFPIRFDPARLVLLDRGVIFAIAHVRGGAELGKAWHDAGRMAKKENTFRDFVAAAERLIEAGYTEPSKLVVEGRSAGGLLMGAVLNMRPDLFRAVITAVPFVDVLSTMLDTTLPLTVTEYEEWGNPNVPEEYAIMRAYSPYDNLASGAYPAILVKTSLNDSQVPYWEPAKLVAKLRALKTDEHVLLLKTNMEAGHGGASGRYDALRERALDDAFLLTQVGLS